MSTTNTTSNWLRFGAFSITVVSASSIPLATGPWPLFSSPWPLFSRPAPCAAGRKLGSFFRPILPLFVLSINVPTTNTRANWLRFGAFLSPPVPSLRIHWPLTTVYWPLFTCHWPQFSRHSPLATRHSPLATTSQDPPPLATTSHRPPNCQSPNGARSRRAGPLSHYAPNRAIPVHKSIRSFPLAAAHPLTVLSWPEGLHASGSRRACLMHTGRNACSFVALPDFPEFAQAV